MTAKAVVQLTDANAATRDSDIQREQATVFSSSRVCSHELTAPGLLSPSARVHGPQSASQTVSNVRPHTAPLPAHAPPPQSPQPRIPTPAPSAPEGSRQLRRAVTKPTSRSRSLSPPPRPARLHRAVLSGVCLIGSCAALRPHVAYVHTSADGRQPYDRAMQSRQLRGASRGAPVAGAPPPPRDPTARWIGR
eukprot:365754-Chlamydomonas_euryale.AAC.7